MTVSKEQEDKFKKKFPGVNLNNLDWLTKVEVVNMSEEIHKEIKEPPSVIEGVFREGEKMLITAPSKAGKTFFTIDAVLAIATGTEFLGFKCIPHNVLYVNFEVRKEMFSKRVQIRCRKRGLDQIPNSFHALNLRSLKHPTENRRLTLKETTELIIFEAIRFDCDVIVIDPLYKMAIGNENDSDFMGEVLASIDTIAECTKAGILEIHHFSKSGELYQDSINKSAGSGLIGRDIDGSIAISPLRDLDKITSADREAAGVGELAKAYMLEYDFRNQPLREPDRVWFDDTSFILDSAGALAKARQGKRKSNGKPSMPLIEKQTLMIESLDKAFTENPELVNKEGAIRLPDLDHKVTGLDGTKISRAGLKKWFNNELKGNDKYIMRPEESGRSSVIIRLDNSTVTVT